MNDAAFHGLAGDVVRFLEPETEADPAGLLLTFLTAFGAAVGSGPHAIADGASHPARLNTVLVGRTARSRKGTSWQAIRRIFDAAAPEFSVDRVIGGLASGEGLVADLANRGDGVDRSVLVCEPEFARFLRVAGHSATLSALTREAWDGNDLSILTRNKQLRARGANVAILGHITADELRARLSQVEIANGLANRFLLCWVDRSQRLPHGGNIDAAALDVLSLRVADAIADASELGLLTRSPEAARLWETIYLGLDDDVAGVVGCLSARAEAQVLRLSVAYALLDASETIEVAHLKAAWAVWSHCADTITRVFASHDADAVLPRLLAALQDAGTDGLDGTQQRDLFGRHLEGRRLALARVELERRGLARTLACSTGGRPRVITTLVAPEKHPASLDGSAAEISPHWRAHRGAIRSGVANAAPDHDDASLTERVNARAAVTCGVSEPDGSLTEVES
jgi:hypothetical protein